MNMSKLVEAYKNNFKIGKAYKVQNRKLKGNESKIYYITLLEFGEGEKTHLEFRIFTEYGLNEKPKKRVFKNVEDLEFDYNVTMVESILNCLGIGK